MGRNLFSLNIRPSLRENFSFKGFVILEGKVGIKF